MSRSSLTQLAQIAACWLLWCAAYCWQPTPVAAQLRSNRAEPARPVNGAEQAIRAAAQAYAKAYNAGDARALAALWTEDGDYTDELGANFQGRGAIQEHFDRIFKEHSGVRLEVRTEGIRFLGPAVAIESGIAIATPPEGSATSARYTAVQVERDGAWLLASVRDAPHVATSNYEHLSDLDWLVGQWRADSPEGQLKVKYEWTANKNFLVRTYTVQQGDQLRRAGTQIIGWDPRGGQIASWHFDSDGGFGQDRWSQDGQQWFITADAVLRDGSESVATNILKPLDANRFTWHSIDRSLNSAPLPDTEAITLNRVAAAPDNQPSNR